VDESSPGQDRERGKNYAGIVVMASGLFGLAAAGIMYYDAYSKGEEFLQDSLLLISGATILGVISFILGLYLYIKYPE
jgi:hypothetical protein